MFLRSPPPFPRRQKFADIVSFNGNFSGHQKEILHDITNFLGLSKNIFRTTYFPRLYKFSDISQFFLKFRKFQEYSKFCQKYLNFFQIHSHFLPEFA